MGEGEGQKEASIVQDGCMTNRQNWNAMKSRRRVADLAEVYDFSSESTYSDDSTVFTEGGE